MAAIQIRKVLGEDRVKQIFASDTDPVVLNLLNHQYLYRQPESAFAQSPSSELLSLLMVENS